MQEKSKIVKNLHSIANFFKMMHHVYVGDSNKINRSGKSTLFKPYIDYLNETCVDPRYYVKTKITRLPIIMYFQMKYKMCRLADKYKII